MRRTHSAYLVLCLAGAFALAAPAAADWLVTRDGAEIQTDGPWRVEGEQVLFTLHGGGLVSLPLADVDLEASARRTAPPAAASAGAKPASRWTITDADVARALDLGEEEGEAAEGSGRPARGLAGVTVVSWEETEAPELGVALTATLRNAGVDYATSLRVVVALYDEEGQEIERKVVVPLSSVLAPGQETQLDADFPDVVGFAEVRFEVQGQGIAGAPAEEEPEPVEEAGETEYVEES